MSHELTMKRGTAEMAYVGELPWHGLGQQLDPAAAIDEWIEAAGMDWTIRRAKLNYFADRAEIDQRFVEDEVALIRSDTGEKLGIVSSDYQIVQPYEVLEFFRDLVDESGFKIETAGTLFGGKRFWALAKITQATLAGWDQIGGYMLLSTSADGSRATEGQECVTRVVCNNTIRMAWGEQVKNKIRITHRERFNHQKVKQQLGLVTEHFDVFTKAAQALAKKKVSEAAAEEFVLKLLRPTAETTAMVKAATSDDSFEALLQRPLVSTLESEEEVSIRRPRGADKILDLFMGEGMGAAGKGAKGTAWGLLNAVTEYVDHHTNGKTEDHIVDRMLWGTGADLKEEAMALAVQQFA